MWRLKMINRQEILQNRLLALSWKEPYGGLMLLDKIETRSWYTSYRGLVMICCSKAGFSHQQIYNISGEIQFERIIGALSKLDRTIYSENFGKAIAVARLIQCRPMTKQDEDACFVQYFPDLLCHVYKHITPIVPFPWKGTQGWKEVNDSIKNQIIIKTT